VSSAPHDEDPWDSLLGDLTSASGEVPLDASGAVPRILLSSIETTSRFCCVGLRIISSWRKEKWWPGSKAPKPFEVWSDDLDRALLGAGLAGVGERRSQAAKALTPPPVPGGPTLPPDLFDFEALKGEAWDGDPDDAKAIEKDLHSARRTARRLETLLSSFHMESLRDPGRARLFTNFTEALTKCLTRTAGLEETLQKIRIARGDLLPLDRVHAITETFAGAVLSRLGDLVEGAADASKTLEIEAHGASKVDSAALVDALEDLANIFRENVTTDLRDALEGSP
jgi:hypothetical protein